VTRAPATQAGELTQAVKPAPMVVTDDVILSLEPVRAMKTLAEKSSKKEMQKLKLKGAWTARGIRQ